MTEPQHNADEPHEKLSKNGVFAVIVAYHPNEAALCKLICVLLEQQVRIELVSNYRTPQTLLDFVARREGIQLIENAINVGLARAQNQGICAARAVGAEWILFFDQDSVPADGHASNLIKAHRYLVARGNRVATIGPMLWDTHLKAHLPFYVADWFRLIEIRNPATATCTHCSYVLSSGSLVHVSTLDAVGLLDESLFIHNIDIEWCFRAASQGYNTFGCFDVAMQHTVGEGHVLFFGKYHPLHSQRRQYFIFRNSLRLLALPHVPMRWKINETLRIIPRLVVYSMFSPQPLLHLHAGVIGLIDGALHFFGRNDQAR